MFKLDKKRYGVKSMRQILKLIKTDIYIFKTYDFLLSNKIDSYANSEKVVILRLFRNILKH